MKLFQILFIGDIVAKIGSKVFRKLTPTGNTAILGKAILGKAILGEVSYSPKLAKPIIRLETAIGKLDTPAIYLEVGEESLVKLPTPVIYLENEGIDPELVKLETPAIYLEVVEEEPEEPDVSKLDTPTIYLYVIEDELEKLETPVIYLDADATLITANYNSYNMY